MKKNIEKVEINKKRLKIILTKLKNKNTESRGITLVALTITIIVLLILARNKYCNVNRRQWNIKKGRRSERTN